jgi:hypothetical protein
VPYPRNPHFTGREEVLDQLATTLRQNSAAALTQPQAISGLGGIGKTQTAVEYAFQHRGDYAAIFWVRADTTLELSRGMVEIAKVLGLPQANAEEAEAVQATLRWLTHNSDWLLIFDNADDPELVKDFVPPNPAGHVLMTSRAQDFQDLGIIQPVELDVLSPEEALDFLWERTGCQSDNSTEQTAAAELAEELGYLPLALEQAAAYIVTLKARFQDYLTSYRNLALKRLRDPESVATTWLLNFQQVAQSSAAAADLLRLSAFLDPDAIPLELLVLGGSELGEALEPALAEANEDPLTLNELLTPLGRYSLIRLNQETQAYSIHRLVQEVVRAEMPHEERHVWLERAILAMNQAFPNVEFKNWSSCERLLPHAIVLANLEETDPCSIEKTGRLFNQAGYYLCEQGQYSIAERFYLRSFSIVEQQLGPEHPDVASSLNNLAGLYESQGC